MEETKRMRDIIKLLQACYNARENPDFKSKGSTTYCNFAVQYVSEYMGYNDFEGLRANDIYDKVIGDPDWIRVKDEEAQRKANVGALAIAAWKRPERHPGHVAIVVPGMHGSSMKWNSDTVPMVLSIGSVNFIGRGANWAFSEKPEYFVWEGV